MALNCPSDPYLNPLQYGFQYDDVLPVPMSCKRIFPDDLPQHCTCMKCVATRCVCHEKNMPCGEYCNCTQHDITYKNPIK